MNAAIRVVTRRAIFHGGDVFGVRWGYAGLIASDFIPLGLYRRLNLKAQHRG